MKNILSMIITASLILGGFYVFALDQSDEQLMSTTNSLDDMMCTMQYEPVCAEVQVQCIKAPCNPVQQTFGNSCELSKNPNAKFLYTGECKTSVDETFKSRVQKVLGKYLNNKTIKSKLLKLIDEALTKDISEDKISKLQYIKDYLSGN